MPVCFVTHKLNTKSFPNKGKILSFPVILSQELWMLLIPDFANILYLSMTLQCWFRHFSLFILVFLKTVKTQFCSFFAHFFIELSRKRLVYWFIFGFFLNLLFYFCTTSDFIKKTFKGLTQIALFSCWNCRTIL